MENLNLKFDVNGIIIKKMERISTKNICRFIVSKIDGSVLNSFEYNNYELESAEHEMLTWIEEHLIANKLLH